MNLAVQSSSHFNGSLKAILHAHRRGVSAQYVNRSVYVGMLAVTTMLTDERRLALAALSVDGPARRTGLRSVHGWHLNQVAAPFLKFVGEDRFKGVPALIQDGSVKPRLLTDIRARRIHSTGGTRRHVGDLQVFHNNGAEPLGDAQSGLVVPVSADAGTFGGQAGRALNGPQPSLGALLSTGNNALRGTLLALDRDKARRNREQFSGRKGQSVGNAAINANYRGSIYRRCMFNFASKAHMPSVGVEQNACILYTPQDRAALAKPNYANFGELNSGPFCIDTPNYNLPPLESEAIVLALPASRRVTRLSREKFGKGKIKVPQRVCLAGLGNVSNPTIFTSQKCQLATLRGEAYVLPVAAQILPPEVPTLLQCKIVDKSAHASVLLKRSFLLCRRVQLEAKGAIDHSRNLT